MRVAIYKEAGDIELSDLFDEKTCIGVPVDYCLQLGDYNVFGVDEMSDEYDQEGGDGDGYQLFLFDNDGERINEEAVVVATRTYEEIKLIFDEVFIPYFEMQYAERIKEMKSITEDDFC